MVSHLQKPSFEAPICNTVNLHVHLHVSDHVIIFLVFSPPHCAVVSLRSVLTDGGSTESRGGGSHWSKA